MKLRKRDISIGFLYLIGLGLILLTNPERISPVLLAAPLLIFATALFLSFLSFTEHIARLKHTKVSRKIKICLAIVVGIPTLLLVLQSIGQLTIRDTITLIAIMLLLGFYISRFKFIRP